MKLFLIVNHHGTQIACVVADRFNFFGAGVDSRYQFFVGANIIASTKSDNTVTEVTTLVPAIVATTITA